MLRPMVAASGRPLSLSLAQSHRRPTVEGPARADRGAEADGLPIRAQVAPRPVGILVGLEPFYPFPPYPVYKEIAELPLAGGSRRCGTGLSAPACSPAGRDEGRRIVGGRY